MDLEEVGRLAESHRMVVVELGQADAAAVARAITEAVALQRRR